jgi:tRNA(Ile)-lysidine synthase
MTQPLDEAMRGFHPVLPLGVAFSGGADSTALLVACASQWPGQVVALHVNHGLQSAASLFENQCRTLCASMNVPLRVQVVDARSASGQSPEDAARRARYKALVALARIEHAQPAIKSIAIAQHADDQAETLLLALSRGAGLGGLSSMPAQWQFEGIDFFRPLLQVAGADIRTWLASKSVQFVEDPTNQDERFTRNRIRARLLPALQEAFPQFRDTFGRSAAHAAQAQTLLDELAQQDMALVCPGVQVDLNANTNRGLVIRSLQTLSRARQANVLRFWLKKNYAVLPSTAQLAELQDQLADCTTRGHRIHIKLAQGFAERSGEMLTWYNP